LPGFALACDGFASLLEVIMTTNAAQMIRQNRTENMPFNDAVAKGDYTLIKIVLIGNKGYVASSLWCAPIMDAASPTHPLCIV
jgi:hypothetical protein